MHNDSGPAYTLAIWRVKEGKEEEFVEAWKGELAEFFLSLPNPPETGTLIRSMKIRGCSTFSGLGAGEYAGSGIRTSENASSRGFGE